MELNLIDDIKTIDDSRFYFEFNSFIFIEKRDNQYYLIVSKIKNNRLSITQSFNVNIEIKNIPISNLIELQDENSRKIYFKKYIKFLKDNLL